MSGVSAGTDRDRVIAALWQALSGIEDPEIPVSIVGMGLIVDLDYDALVRTARVRLTFTAMGCPAMDMIQDDIRTGLLRSPSVEAVDIDVVWDPVWSPERLSRSARRTMKSLGVAI
ncbi:MAG: iron-sulfur cluster assembly protein [Chloroflexota bacterium]